MKTFRIALILSIALTACASNVRGFPPFEETLPVPVPTLDLREVNEGRKIYQVYCASCHGANAEGAPNWKTPDAEFNFPAPPHDDRGHTWHHSDKLLTEIIRDGLTDALKPDAPKRMQPFGNQLSDAQIRAVLVYFKSLWSRDHREFQWRVTNNNFEPTQTPSQ